MQWNTTYQESIFSFANNINTHEGGSHLSGFRSALTRTLNRYAREQGLLKEKDDNLSGEDVREGLTAVISAKLADPQFEGQTKTKLGNPGMEGFVALDRQRRARPSSSRRTRRRRDGDHPQGGLGRAGPRRRAQGARPDAPQVARWRTRRCRASSPTARSRTRRWPRSSSSRATPPAARPSRAATATRRRSCRCAARSSTSRRAGSTRSCRTTRSRRSSPRSAPACATSSTSRAPRYHKVILMTDADVDGAHIRTLVLTLLFREMRELIEAGYVYIAKPPLYKLKQGTQERYIEKESELEEHPARATSSRSSTVFDRDGKPFKLTEARWQRFTPAAQAVRGLGVARCAPSTATTPSRFLEESAILDEQVDRRRGARSTLLEREDPEGEPLRRPSSSRRDDEHIARPRGRAQDRPGARRTASAARCSTRTSTAQFVARARASSSSWPARRRSPSRSATQRRRGAVVRGAARRGARASRRRASRSSASRAWAR